MDNVAEKQLTMWQKNNRQCGSKTKDNVAEKTIDNVAEKQLTMYCYINLVETGYMKDWQRLKEEQGELQ